MRSTPSPNPFDRLMGWLRLSRGEGPAWEGWARRACPPVLCSDLDIVSSGRIVSAGRVSFRLCRWSGDLVSVVVGEPRNRPARRARVHSYE